MFDKAKASLGTVAIIAAGNIYAEGISAGDNGHKGLFIGNTSVTAIYYDTSDKNSTAGAKELVDYLEKVLDQKFTLHNAKTESNFSKPGIFIGSALVPEEFKKDVPKNDEEWFCRAVAENKMYLWGNDQDKNFNGTRWAVQDFLERDCGVRWLWPGKLGEVVPKKKLISVTDTREIHRPIFKIREIKPGYMVAGYSFNSEEKDVSIWQLRMRLGRSLFGYKGSSGFGHSFHIYLPQKEYGISHPEYYSLVTPRNWVTSPKPEHPERTNTVTNWQVCTSNPDVRRIIAEKIISNKSPDIQTITPNDGFAFCECEKCKTQDAVQWDTYTPPPILSDRIFDFARDIAEQVKAKSPASKVGVLAYSFYTDPPTKIKKFPDNLYICICYSCGEFRDPVKKRDFEKQISGFRAIGAKFNAYEYWGTHYYFDLPWLHTKLIDENLKFFSRNGGDGIRGEGGKNWANDALNYYLLSKLLWNPELSREDIVDDFCRNAFGKGSETMKDYFSLLETAVDKWFEKQLKNKQKTEGYAVKMNGFSKMFNPEVINRAEKLLNEAKKKSVLPEQKERVDFFKSGLEYTKIVVEMIRDYRMAAACGVNLMFVWPETGITSISDPQIEKILLAAASIGKKREKFLCKTQGTCALDMGMLLHLNGTDKHPWDKIIQDNLWAWRKGEYNYLVNGAFEYDGFGWDISSGNDKNSYSYDVVNNHDDITNAVAQYHARQGKSLKVNLEPKSTITANSTVKVKTKPEIRWSVSGWMQQFSGTSELDGKIIWNIDGQMQEAPLRIQVKNEIIKDSQGWYEVQFLPFTVPDGKDIEFNLVLQFSNNGQDAAIARIDDFKLKKIR